MTPQEAAQQMYNKIMALDPALIRPPTYKVENRVVEGQRVYKEGMSHLDLFEKLSSIDFFPLEYLTELEMMALTLRHYESEWAILRNPGREQSFVDLMTTIHQLRGDLLRDLDYIEVRYKPEKLAANLAAVRKGNSNKDELQDLETLCSLAKQHRELLEKIGFDASIVNTASSLAADAGRLISPMDGEVEKRKEIRNRASSLLETMMSEVRAAGKYIFRNDPNIVAKFDDQGR